MLLSCKCSTNTLEILKMELEQLVLEIEGILACDERMMDWLTETIQMPADPFGLTEQVTVPRWYQYFMYIARNGGRQVVSWGMLSSAGLFGTGLEQNEALTLIGMDAYICGMENMDGDPNETIGQAFNRFIEIHVKIREEENAWLVAANGRTNNTSASNRFSDMVRTSTPRSRRH